MTRELHGVGQGFRTDLLKRRYEEALEKADFAIMDEFSVVRLENPYVASALRDTIERDYVAAKVKDVYQDDDTHLEQIEVMRSRYKWVDICVSNLIDLDEVDELIEDGLLVSGDDIERIPDLTSRDQEYDNQQDVDWD